MSEHIGERLKAEIAKARIIVIVAPYIKSNTMQRLTSSMVEVELFVVVTRWSVEDLRVGVSDLSVRELAMEYNGKFMLHSSLHAKYYRLDNKVFVGSANVTDAAMGWENNPNLEIMCEAGIDFSGADFEKNLISEAYEVGDEEFECWRSAVQFMDRRLHEEHEGSNRLSGWWPRARDVESVILTYAGRSNDIVSMDERRSARIDLEEMNVPNGLQYVELGGWISNALLSSRLARSVLRNQDPDTMSVVRELAGEFNLNVIEARRAREAVQRWVSALKSLETR